VNILRKKYKIIILLILIFGIIVVSLYSYNKENYEKIEMKNIDTKEIEIIKLQNESILDYIDLSKSVFIVLKYNNKKVIYFSELSNCTSYKNGKSYINNKILYVEVIVKNSKNCTLPALGYIPSPNLYWLPENQKFDNVNVFTVTSLFKKNKWEELSVSIHKNNRNWNGWGSED
jgi:hypothetical protein